MLVSFFMDFYNVRHFVSLHNCLYTSKTRVFDSFKLKTREIVRKTTKESDAEE